MQKWHEICTNALAIIRRKPIYTKVLSPHEHGEGRLNRFVAEFVVHGNLSHINPKATLLDVDANPSRNSMYSRYVASGKITLPRCNTHSTMYRGETSRHLKDEIRMKNAQLSGSEFCTCNPLECKHLEALGGYDAPIYTYSLFYHNPVDVWDVINESKLGIGYAIVNHFPIENVDGDASIIVDNGESMVRFDELNYNLTQRVAGNGDPYRNVNLDYFQTKTGLYLDEYFETHRFLCWDNIGTVSSGHTVYKLYAIEADIYELIPESYYCSEGGWYIGQKDRISASEELLARKKFKVDSFVKQAVDRCVSRMAPGTRVTAIRDWVSRNLNKNILQDVDVSEVMPRVTGELRRQYQKMNRVVRDEAQNDAIQQIESGYVELGFIDSIRYKFARKFDLNLPSSIVQKTVHEDFIQTEEYLNSPSSILKRFQKWKNTITGLVSLSRSEKALLLLGATSLVPMLKSAMSFLKTKACMAKILKACSTIAIPTTFSMGVSSMMGAISLTHIILVSSAVVVFSSMVYFVVRWRRRTAHQPETIC
jgi:hypothetical protein